MAFALPAEAVASGYRLETFGTVGSTSAVAIERARDGDPGGTWFVTDHQTAGTGRRGSAWQTPKGNLAASLLMTSGLPPATLATLGFVAGLALVRALDLVSPGPAFLLKWPNDVLVEDAKLAGILLGTETVGGAGRAVVVGIGVNVVAAPDDVPVRVSSLRSLGAGVGAPDLFGALAKSWCLVHETWDEGRGFGAVRESWLARAAGLGRDVSVRSGHGVVGGTFETIDDHGQLVLRDSGGVRRRVSAGEVYFGNAGTLRPTSVGSEVQA